MARDITKLHPKVKELAEAVQMRMVSDKIPFKITECVRTEAEQNAYYRKGTSKQKYPNSFHCWGLAFDMCHNVQGDIGNKRVLSKAAQYAKEEGKKRGLEVEWGGDWKTFYDPYHIQVNDFGTTQELAKKYGTPEAFFETFHNGTISRGDRVRLKSGAKYTNGVSVPKNYIGREMTVLSDKGDRLLLKEVYSWVYAKDCEKLNAEHMQVLVTAKAINIRDGAGTQNNIVSLARQGDVYTISETTDIGSMTWGRCEKGWFGLTGYTKRID